MSHLTRRTALRQIATRTAAGVSALSLAACALDSDPTAARFAFNSAVDLDEIERKVLQLCRDELNGFRLVGLRAQEAEPGWDIADVVERIRIERTTRAGDI